MPDEVAQEIERYLLGAVRLIPATQQVLNAALL
jgi:hypothetical protein